MALSCVPQLALAFGNGEHVSSCRKSSVAVEFALRSVRAGPMTPVGFAPRRSFFAFGVTVRRFLAVVCIIAWFVVPGRIQSIGTGPARPVSALIVVDQMRADKQLGSTSPATLALDPPEPCLDYPSAAAHGVGAAVLDGAIGAAIYAQPGIARADTVADLRSAASSTDPFVKTPQPGSTHPQRRHSRARQAQLLLPSKYRRHAGTPYEYDAHVPMIWMGAGIRPGTKGDRVRINDLAPTLGASLRVPYRGDPDGRVLTQAPQAASSPGAR